MADQKSRGGKKVGTGRGQPSEQHQGTSASKRRPDMAPATHTKHRTKK